MSKWLLVGLIISAVVAFAVGLLAGVSPTMLASDRAEIFKFFVIFCGCLCLFNFAIGLKTKTVPGFITGHPIAYGNCPKPYWIVTVVYFLGGLFLFAMGIKLILG